MEAEPTFNSEADAVTHWRRVAIERQADFDELQEMSADYEREMDAQIEKLENDKKTANIQNSRLLKELEQYREKQREKDTEREDELQRLKQQLENEISQRVSTLGTIKIFKCLIDRKISKCLIDIIDEKIW